MLPWIHLATAPVPGDGPDLRLMRRGTEFSIMSGGIELMNSRLSGSEEALARLACAPLASPSAGVRAPGVLIGGLGMGFTLRAAQGVLPAQAAIVVAELVPAVVAWARGPLAPVFGGCLDDPRVAIHEGDVGALIAASAGAFDAILLDVDNGPDGLTRSENDGLYGRAGLAAAARALRPGGVLAVWSSGRDPAFTRRLSALGFSVSEHPVRARGRRGARHMIWIATRSR